MRSLFALTLTFSGIVQAASIYTERIDDPKAVYLTESEFGVKGDGETDDTAAIQAAIDKVSDTTGEGILFIPEGKYRITRTVYVWPGIRVIGYGKLRPLVLLAAHTPGYQSGVADMFFYAGARPGNRRSANAAAFPGGAGFAAFHGPESPPGTVPPNRTMPDANPGTFYSAMSNIDFQIGDDNAGAVAIRFHAAQHAFLAHMDFHTGSGLAALNDVGNEGEDLHFYGGRYGILTRKPSPAWQFTLLDSSFEDQREAAIRENEAGLTLVHDTFRNVPTAVAIDRGYSDELWIKDGRFENISGPAIVISNENSRLTEINGEDILCRNVPTFAQFADSKRTLTAPAEIYNVKIFAYGLTLPREGVVGAMQTKFQVDRLSAITVPKPRVIAELPPVSEWTNVLQLGTKGDGKTDDTAALQKAISAHRVLYVPMGKYIVTDTLLLRPDTVLIALHPNETQFIIPDRTPAYLGPGPPKALLATPENGHNIVSGIGLYTNGFNTRAVAALWMSGADSLMDDVRFLGGHGTSGINGERVNPYNNTHTGDPDPHRKWDSQYPSLWVLHGGGIFANIWTPSTFAQAGLYISDTKIPGRVFELSAEHHVRVEIKLKNVANWELDALQTEGEVGESAHAYSLDIDGCSNLTIANYHGYRVVRSYHPFPYAVRVAHSSNIRFRNLHVDNNSSIASCDATGEHCTQLVRAGKVGFESAIWNVTTGIETRDRELAWLDVSEVPGPAPLPHDAAPLHKLAGGFFNVNGGTADANGDLYFTDPYLERIYRLKAATKDLTVVRDNPLDPVNLTFDRSGNLLVVSSGGRTETVYAFHPGTPDNEITILERQPAEPHPNMSAAVPVDYWVNGDFKNTLNTETYEYATLEGMFRSKLSTQKPYQYVSPDRSVYIPETEVFVQGESYFGSKWSDLLIPTGLVQARTGQTVYVTNESEEKTYSGKLGADGTISDLKLFAYQGGESVATDKAGNVYIAAGQIYIYNQAAKPVGIIRVPERPTHLVFGGKDGHTLFVLAHTSVYATHAVASTPAQ
jgi:sugar lactone lactonase YvrE